jgi:hypothetical protein
MENSGEIRLKADYMDVADFIEYCKTQGVTYFKGKDLEISFEKTQDAVMPKNEEPVIEGTGLADDMPSDEEMLFASSETLEFPKENA